MKTSEKNISISDEDYIKLEHDFFDENYIIESEYCNYRIDKGSQRFYVRVFEDNRHFVAPSFTAIMREVKGVPYNLADWLSNMEKQQSEFERIYSAHYGKYIHLLFCDILRGKQIPFDEISLLLNIEMFCQQENINYNEIIRWYRFKKRSIQDDVIGFVCWKKEYNVIPIAMEYPLMHNEGLWAGTCDVVCKITIKDVEYVAMIDLKSTLNGFYEENEIQLYAYSTLWDQEFPNLQIEKRFNYGCNNFRRKTLFKYLSGGKTGNFKPYMFKDQTDSTNIYKWDLYVKLYHDGEESKIKSSYKYDKNIVISSETDLSEILKETNVIDEIMEKHTNKTDEKNEEVF